MREFTEQEKREKCFAIFDKALKNNSDNSLDTAVDNDANNVECLFDYCISNPPYQKKTGKSENSKITYKRVYDAFQYYASSMAKDTVMIYPSFWLNNVRRGLGAWCGWF